MYKLDALKKYTAMGATLIPLHKWDSVRKNSKGKEVQLGKVPKDTKWQSRDFEQSQDSYLKWTSKGGNLGYRIPNGEIVIDIDPRHYKKGIDSCDKLAEMLGYFDVEEMIEDNVCVKTGGGGYHIYCRIPADLDIDCEVLSNALPDDELPGVEFKRKYVVAAGSRHPDGEFYQWCEGSQSEKREIDPAIIKKLVKKYDPADGAESSVITAQELDELVLAKLNPEIERYLTYEHWRNLLFACHHATGGLGEEVFVKWSAQAEGYEDHEDLVRDIWRAASTERTVSATARTLVFELRENGFKAAANTLDGILEFNALDVLDPRELVGEDSHGQKEMLRNAYVSMRNHFKKDAVLTTPGEAIKLAQAMGKDSTEEDFKRCIEVIACAATLEQAEASAILAKNTPLSKAQVNKKVASYATDRTDSLALTISDAIAKHLFNEGHHILQEPGGILYRYCGTHWVTVPEATIKKHALAAFEIYKKSTGLKGVREIAIANDATALLSAKASDSLGAARLNTKAYVENGVLNCTNGELWLGEDGSFIRKDHSYTSYQVNCLDIEFNPDAKCPKFIEMLKGIFSDLEDEVRDDMIRHIFEIFGYVMQPKKFLEAWFMFHGRGSNGKSGIINIFKKILGSAKMEPPVSILDAVAGAQNSDKHSTFALAGKNAIFFDDIDPHAKLNSTGLKKLSAPYSFTANPKGTKHEEIEYTGTMILSGNGYFPVREQSFGFTRRINVIPFTKTFEVGKDADTGLYESILNDRAELSGILNECLAGFKRIRARGMLKIPEPCAKAKDHWFNESNATARFINTMLVKQIEGSQTKVKDIKEVYQAWCESEDILIKHRLQRQKLVNALKDRGFHISDNTKGGWQRVTNGGFTLEGYKTLKEECCVDIEHSTSKLFES
jgi:P4 family phage/plasmid primase-like protien